MRLALLKLREALTESGAMAPHTKPCANCRGGTSLAPWRRLTSAEFEEHLASCEICRTEVSALRPVAAALPGTVAQVKPPALLRGGSLKP